MLLRRAGGGPPGAWERTTRQQDANCTTLRHRGDLCHPDRHHHLYTRRPHRFIHPQPDTHRHSHRHNYTDPHHHPNSHGERHAHPHQYTLHSSNIHQYASHHTYAYRHPGADVYIDPYIDAISYCNGYTSAHSYVDSHHPPHLTYPPALLSFCTVRQSRPRDSYTDSLNSNTLQLISL